MAWYAKNTMSPQSRQMPQGSTGGGTAGPQGPAGPQGAQGPVGEPPVWHPATVPISLKTYEASATVTAVGVSPSSNIEVILAPGSDMDENTSDMLSMIAVRAVPGDGSFDLTMQFSQPESGPVKILWRA